MAIPFIQLFKTPRSQYVYDVNKNEMIPVTEESFRYLQDCMKGSEDVTLSDSEEIQELRRQGYLGTKSVVEEICHPYTPYLTYFLNRKVA